MAKALGPPVEKVCSECRRKFVTRTVLSTCADCNVVHMVANAARKGWK